MIRIEDHERIAEAARTFCPRCQVPYGQHGCEHRAPFDNTKAIEELVSRYGIDGARLRLLATFSKIGIEEEHKQRLRNAQHALRYRAEAAILARTESAKSGAPDGKAAA